MERGERVKQTDVRYRLEGTFNAARDNVVLVVHTSDDPWARVAGPFDRIVVYSETAGSPVFEGPGSGGRATAGAVFTDIVAK